MADARERLAELVYAKIGCWISESEIEGREASEAAADAILAEWDCIPKGMLNDPTVVHLNMLRGGIAQPTVAQIEHVYRRRFESVPAHNTDEPDA